MKKCDFCRFSNEDIKCTVRDSSFRSDYCEEAINKMVKIMCNSIKTVNLGNGRK